MANTTGKRLGGRAKGTPNKDTVQLLQYLDEKNFDVLGELIALVRETENPIIKSKVLMGLMEFVYPKRKAIEISGENPFADKSIEQLKALVQEKLK